MIYAIKEYNRLGGLTRYSIVRNEKQIGEASLLYSMNGITGFRVGILSDVTYIDIDQITKEAVLEIDRNRQKIKKRVTKKGETFKVKSRKGKTYLIKKDLYTLEYNVSIKGNKEEKCIIYYDEDGKCKITDYDGLELDILIAIVIFLDYRR